MVNTRIATEKTTKAVIRLATNSCGASTMTQKTTWYINTHTTSDKTNNGVPLLSHTWGAKQAPATTDRPDSRSRCASGLSLSATRRRRTALPPGRTAAVRAPPHCRAPALLPLERLFLPHLSENRIQHAIMTHRHDTVC